MRTYVLILMNLVLFAPNSFSQPWQKVADFEVYRPHYLYNDTLDNSLYIAGRFVEINTQPYFGITKLQNDSFYQLSCGIDWNCVIPYTGNIVYGYSIINYANEIYLTGSFSKVGNIPANSIGKWNGQNWSAIGQGLKYQISNGSGYVFSEIDNELYIGGSFDSAFGLQVNSLVKYDGQNWSDVFNFPEFNSNYVVQIVKYKNKLYVGGQFYSGFGANDINAITVYDGTNWVKVGTGIPNPNDAISDMVVYKNELIVAGHFTKQTNPLNPGNNIAAWDGTNWHSLGDATQNYGITGINESVVRMIVHGDYLYVCGRFTAAGGQPATHIARWDGQNWCALATDFNQYSSVVSLAFYGDTLFAVGDFLEYNGDSTIRYAAKLPNPDNWVTNCTTVGENEFEKFSNKILAFPNPVDNKLYFKGITKKIKIDIYNNLGQLQQTNLYLDSNGIDISNLAKGFYIYIITDQQQRVMTTDKFVKE